MGAKDWDTSAFGSFVYVLGWGWWEDHVPTASGGSQKKVAQEIEVTAQDFSVVRTGAAGVQGTVLMNCFARPS